MVEGTSTPSMRESGIGFLSRNTPESTARMSCFFTAATTTAEYNLQPDAIRRAVRIHRNNNCCNGPAMAIAPVRKTILIHTYKRRRHSQPSIRENQLLLYTSPQHVITQKTMGIPGLDLNTSWLGTNYTF